MPNLILSKPAKKDIQDIFEYGRSKFGRNEALVFIRQMRDLIKDLAKNRNLGRDRTDIKAGLFSFPFKGYLVFYRKESLGIYVVRILHGSRDIPYYF